MGTLLQPVGFSLAHLFIKLPLYRFPDAIFKIALKVMNRSIKFVINIHLYIQFDFQFSSFSRVRLFATPWTAAYQASLSINNSQRACSNSCPSSRWCHPTISSSVVPFSSCLQSFPALGSFQMSQFFTLGSQSIGVSASTSVLPMNIQDWFPLGLTGWISLLSKRLSRAFSNTQFKSISSWALNFLYSPTLTSIYDYWKNHNFD